MESIVNIFTIVLTIVYGIIGWVLYHKIFNVYYFDLSNGLFKEFISSALFGFAMASLTITYWWVAYYAKSRHE